MDDKKKAKLARLKARIKAKRARKKLRNDLVFFLWTVCVLVTGRSPRQTALYIILAVANTMTGYGGKL